MGNNPIRYRDPTGMLLDESVIAARTGVLVEYGTSTASALAGGALVAIPLILAIGSSLGPGPLLKDAGTITFEVDWSRPREPGLDQYFP